MANLKRALSYDEQIKKLVDSHNLCVSDEESAIEILKKVNYYRLTAYGIGLKQADNPELYKDGISIEHLYRLYSFDSRFRSLLFHVIEKIEIKFRSQLAYYIGLKYGAEGYMEPENFCCVENKEGTPIHKMVIDNFKKEIERQKNVPFVKHHLEKYEGHFPIWVAVELFTFGNLSSLYSIMKVADKKSIAKLYNTEPNYLGGWLLALVEIRNICAHYGRLYNMPLKQRPYLYSENKQYQGSSINKMFPVLLTMKRLLDGDSLWREFSTELICLLDEYDDVINFSFMNFPKNWREVLNA